MSQQLRLFDSLDQYEGVDLEYKSAKGGLPHDLWPTYSAFANTDGGVIYLGVAERPDGTLDVHGLRDAQKLVKTFWDTVNNRSKVNRNLLRDQDVALIALDEPGLSVIRIEVPRASRFDRPIYVGTDPFAGTYRRSSEADYRCSEIEVRRMFADQSDESRDSQILDGFTLDDLHEESLRQFRNVWGSRSSGDPWLTESNLGMLTKLGGWRRDRLSQREGLTVAGLLMFGKLEAIQDPAAIPGFHLDYRERFSDDPGIRYTDRVTSDGSFECNLFQFYQQVILKLSSGPGVKRPFQVDAEGYRRTATPVSEALQEALVNALIHCDYAGQGGVVIDRHLERVEFSNPGTLLISREQLLRGGVSECRNKALQKMFQKLGVGDKLGSGIDKIRSGWQAAHLLPPVLHETQRPDRVVLILPLVSLMGEEVLSDLYRRFGEAEITGLQPEALQALATACEEGEVSNRRLQEQLSLHRVDITQMLQRLVRDGFLVPEGIGRGRRYALGGHAGTAGSSLLKPASSPLKQGGLPSLGLPAPPLGVEPAPEADPRLLAIAEPVRRTRRASPQLLGDVILALCEGRFLSIRQLATLLNRDPENLRQKHVSRLVRRRELELRYPSTPTHEDQGYRRRPS
jgi:ATP-dependent DNA helicase RecG